MQQLLCTGKTGKHQPPEFSEKLQIEYFDYMKKPEKVDADFEIAYNQYKIEQIENLFTTIEFPPAPEDEYKLDESHPNYPKIIEILKKEPSSEFEDFPLKKVRLDLDLKIELG